MKKPFVLIAAIAAVVGLGAAVAVAKERIEVETTVTIKFKRNNPGENPYIGGASFSGQVKARRGCQSDAGLLCIPGSVTRGR